MTTTKLKNIISCNKSDYVNKILSKELVIYEELSMPTILFEYTDNGLSFYKKDFSLIDTVDITINENIDTYMTELRIITKNNETIKKHHIYELYCNDRNDNYAITNKYILNNIIDNTNKEKKYLSCDIVAECALKLKVGLPPILYKGYLNEEQKQTFIEYAQCNFNDLSQKSLKNYINENFTNVFSLDVFEGICIRIYDTNLILKSYEYEILNECATINDEIFIHALYALNECKLNTDKLNYIDIICEMFNKIAESDIIKHLKIGKTYEHSTLKYISNMLTKTYCVCESNENMFMYLLDNMRYYKNESYKLNEEHIELYNKTITTLKQIINEDNVIVKELNKKKTLTDIDNMKLISSIYNTFSDDRKTTPVGMQNCICYVCNLSVFTLSQLRNMIAVQQQFNLPVVLICLNNEESDDVYKISNNLLNAQLKSIQANNNFIVKTINMECINLRKIFDELRPEYEILHMICDETTLSNDFKLQLYLEDHVLGKRIGVYDVFDIVYMENIDVYKIQRSLEDGNVLLFKNNTPPYINMLWDMIYTEYKIWSGKIIVNI